MSTYTVTVDVHDLEPAGPVPAGAELRLARVYPDASGTQVVSTRQHAIDVGAGPTTVTLTASVPYTATLIGVGGWSEPFTFAHNADCSLAELFRSHQVDPSTLQPVVQTPASFLAITDNGDGTATLA